MFLEICYGLYPYSLEVSSVKVYKKIKNYCYFFILQYDGKRSIINIVAPLMR